MHPLQREAGVYCALWLRVEKSFFIPLSYPNCFSRSLWLQSSSPCLPFQGYPRSMGKAEFETSTSPGLNEFGIIGLSAGRII